MSYGLQVFSSSGVVQITDSGSQFQVTSSGSVASVFDPIYGAAANIPGDGMSGNKSLLVRSQTYGKLIYSATTAFYDNNTAKTYIPTGEIGQVIEYVMIDSANTAPSSSGVGLQVLNSSGFVAYNSNYSQAVVTSSISLGVDYNTGAGNYDFTITNAPYSGLLYLFYGSAEYKIVRNTANTASVIFFYNTTFLNSTTVRIHLVKNSIAHASGAPTSEALNILIGVVP